MFGTIISIGAISCIWIRQRQVRELIENEILLEIEDLSDLSDLSSNGSFEELTKVMKCPKPNCSKRIKTPIAFKEERIRERERDKEKRGEKENLMDRNISSS